MARLGILTGGGDCPGLNAVIRAVAKGALLGHGIEVVGFNNGFKGLVENEAWLISEAAVSGILHRGGTILAPPTGTIFHFRTTGPDGKSRYEDCSAQALRHLELWGVDCPVVVGGDGSLALAAQFGELGVPVIGIPKTIDNDLSATDVTFGFDSAAATATEAIDKLHTTAESHHRVMVVEVMGRNAGWIALQAGMAGGGDIILIPEIPFNYHVVIEKILSALPRQRFQHSGGGRRRFSGRKRTALQNCRGREQTPGRHRRSGGCQSGSPFGIESRATVLGHLQRGVPHCF